jgi:hypothetical protein
MIKNSPGLIGLIFVFFFLGLTYNVTSTELIGRTSAVIRTLMEAFRTFLIWMVQFGIFYGLRNSGGSAYKFRLAGEEWSNGSAIQLSGFLLMTFFLLMYNGVPKWPCFNYGPVHCGNEADLSELDVDVTPLFGGKLDMKDDSLKSDIDRSTGIHIQSEITSTAVTNADDAGENEDEDDEGSVRSMSMHEDYSDVEGEKKL